MQNSVHLHNTYKKVNLPGYTYTRTEEYNHIYDHAGRQTGYDYTYNGGTQQTVSNTFNTLGQLVSKQIAEEATTLQTIDYKYNIRGWLTKINDPANLTATGDLFGMELVYNTKNADIKNTPAYNGNISGAIWQSAQPTGITNPNVTGQKAYIYSYDKLNRLLTGDYLEIVSNAWNNTTKKYSESILNSISGKSYDLNGNIQGIVRNGLVSLNVAGVIDRLFYTYDGNKLIAVDDNENSTYGGDFIDKVPKYSVSHTAEYAYDDNGNLTRDDNKGIVNIAYNYLNLPASITNTSGNRLEYTYDARGNKLRQEYYENGTITKTTDFIGNFVYENKIPAWVINNEGRVILNSIGTAYCKEVYLKDHLGNVRVACRLESGILRTRQVDSYYPFGMNIKGLSPNSSTGIRPNEYLYNGKMMQDEMGLVWLDYAARFYDPTIARWHSVDPASEISRKWSPYSYCYNNPIRFIDPDGMVVDKYYDEDGNMLLDTKDGNRDYAVKTSKTQEQVYGNNTKGTAEVNGITPDAAEKTEDLLRAGKVDLVDRSTLVEIPEAGSRQEMLNIVSTDDGKGDGKRVMDSPKNFQEQGGSVDGLGTVRREFPGPVRNPANVKPGEMAAFITWDISVNFKYSSVLHPHTFHGHPSGTAVGADGKTYGFLQPPSDTDQKNGSTGNSYVFGRETGKVYIYDKSGVKAIVPQSVFGR